MIFRKKEETRRGSASRTITKIKKTKPFTVFITSRTPTAFTFTVIMTLSKPRTGVFSIHTVLLMPRDAIVLKIVCSGNMKSPSMVIFQITFVAFASPIFLISVVTTRNPPLIVPLVRSGFRFVMVTRRGETLLDILNQ